MSKITLKIGICGIMLAFLLVLAGCGGKDPSKALIGQWVTVESTAEKDLIADRIEFLGDGTGLLEAKNMRRVGPWAESFTWRIDGNGRLIITSPAGVAQIYSIVEISKSRLILEGNIPVIGNIRTTYLNGAATFRLKIEADAKDGGTVAPAGTIKYKVGTDVEITAAAAEGYVFTGWSGASTDKTPDMTIFMDSDQTLTANFHKILSGTPGTFTDSRDGKTYRHTAKIVGRIWMAENLNFQTGNSWCYQNNESNCQKYGRLYDWNTAMNACPTGWSLPTLEDWNDLVLATGGDVAGSNLKSKTDWDGTDEFGFSALQGGFRSSNGSYGNVSSYGYWWSSTECRSGDAWYRSMGFGNSRLFVNSDVKSYGISVRCVQNID